MGTGADSSSKCVLIITCKEDIHPNPVLNHLKAKNRSVFRLNTEDLLNAYSATLYQTQKEDFLSIEENGMNRQISLQSIGSIWYRRPQKPIPLRSMSGTQDALDFAADESESFLRILYPLLENKFWLSPPWLLNFEKSKIKQLAVAREVGMMVPETIFTNQPEQALAFAKKHGEIALKTLNSRGFRENNQFRSFYTTMIHEADLVSNQEAIKNSINFIQQPIPKKYELRVTVVGDQIFAAKIDSQSANELAKDDWRRINPEEIKHSKEHLPKSLEEKIQAFMQAFKLPFGCIDFIVTPNNDFVFLECNGNGQWLWIENLTEHPISNAIADLLDKHC